MIPVARTPVPSVLQRNSTRWLLDLKTLAADPATTKEQLKRAQNKYRHAQIKDELIRIFHGKCAYCESKITVVAYGQIEHFFPKSIYPDLTFEWSNLLLACNVCNDSGHKGTNFPLDDQGKPLLINPTDGITDPNTHLDFVWDAVAGLATVYGRDERGKTVETIFDLNGLNGRQDLLNHRSGYVKKLFALLRFAQSGEEQALSLLQEACNSDAEYSAFARVHIRPHLP